MTELSTRVWLDEKLWETVRRKAIAEGTTVRDLIPRLVKSAITAGIAPPLLRELTRKTAPATAASEVVTEGPPIVVLSDIYRCGVCDAQVKVGGLTLHMGKHIKERHESDKERS